MDGYLEEIRSLYGTDIWCDSPIPADLTRMIGLGACGATSNPVLILRAVQAAAERWRGEIASCRVESGLPNWNMTRRVGREAAAILRPIYEATAGQKGFQCVQVDPRLWNDVPAMVAMAREAHAVAPNIAVKVPVTHAGVTVVEELAAAGITCTATVSYSVPQVIAVAEAYRRGYARAQAAGILRPDRPVHSFAVLMVGRLDDHLRDVVKERGMSVQPELLTRAGIAVAKKAYRIFRERGYESRLLIAAMRGNYHIDQFVGADLIITIPPANEREFGQAVGERAPLPRIDEAVPQAAIGELSERFVDFRRAYYEDGMEQVDFDTFGPCVKTINQFTQGWEGLIEFVS